MKTMYLYISAGTILDDSSRLFHVMLGESSRERTLVKRLANVAEQRGHYFAKLDHEVMDFISKIRNAYPTLDRIQVIKGTNVQYLIDDVAKVPVCPMSAAQMFARARLSSSYHFSSCSSARKSSLSPCHAPHVKNLTTKV